MATVWAAHLAPRVGRYADRAYDSGWSHTIHFNSLSHLADQMATRSGLQTNLDPPQRVCSANPRIRGHVTRLGIAAHGVTDGIVALDRPLDSSSFASFQPDFVRLRSYLTANAKVIFYSCNVGAGSDGDRLLNLISKVLNGRTIIGFEVPGESQATDALAAMSEQTPGTVREAPHGHGSRRSGAAGLLTPWSIYAKWSRNGVIVRRSVYGRDAQSRCGAAGCPGHAFDTEHCD